MSAAVQLVFAILQAAVLLWAARLPAGTHGRAFLLAFSAAMLTSQSIAVVRAARHNRRRRIERRRNEKALSFAGQGLQQGFLRPEEARRIVFGEEKN